MTSTDHQHGSKLLAIALALSAGLHLAMLAIEHEPPATAAARAGQGGLVLQLVTASTPAAGPANTQPAKVEETIQAMETVATTRHTPYPARRETTPAVKAAETIAPAQHNTTVASQAGTQTALQQANLSTALHMQVRRAMQPYFNYPLLARRRGWQGTVRVGLRIMADGHISQLHIVEASRHPLLDRAAMDSLGNIKSVPEAVAWLGGRHSDIVLPIEYRLSDS